MSSPPLDEELLDAARLFSDTGSFLAAAFADGLGHLVPTRSRSASAPAPAAAWQPGSGEGGLSSVSRVLAPSVSRVVNLADSGGSGAASPTSDVTVHFPTTPLIVFELEDTLASRGLHGDDNVDALTRSFGGARRVAMLDAALSALSEAGASLAVCSQRSRSQVESALGAPSVNLLRHFDSVVCTDGHPEGVKADMLRCRLLEPRDQAARYLCVVDSRPAGLKWVERGLPGCKMLLTRPGGIGPSECRELVQWIRETHRTVYRSDLSDSEPARAGWHGLIFSCYGDAWPLPGDERGLVLSRSSPSWELA
jgi:hypothetical protein